MRIATMLLALVLASSCGSSGDPGTDAGTGGVGTAGDGGLASAGDGGSSDGGSTADGGAAGPDGGAAGPDGGTALADGGGSEPDGGGASSSDGGASAPDAGPPAGCTQLDLAGQWRGTFAGQVWWTTDPGSREPVSGDLELTLTCQGLKFGVYGTMTGSESHAVRFTAQVAGEVTPGSPPVINARFMGNAIFTLLGNASVPFEGTMTGPISGTRVPAGTWRGQSTTPLVPAEGAGTWEATRQ